MIACKACALELRRFRAFTIRNFLCIIQAAGEKLWYIRPQSSMPEWRGQAPRLSRCRRYPLRQCCNVHFGSQKHHKNKKRKRHLKYLRHWSTRSIKTGFQPSLRISSESDTNAAPEAWNSSISSPIFRGDDGLNRLQVNCLCVL